MTLEPDMTRLGVVIREARHSQDLTMARLAERANISASTLHRIEKGPLASSAPVKRPAPENFARVLLVLDLVDQVEDLLGDSTWANHVRYWASHASDVREAIAGRAGPLRRGGRDSEADLSLVHGSATLAVFSRNGGGDDALDRLARAARDAGFEVTVPWRPSTADS